MMDTLPLPYSMLPWDRILMFLIWEKPEVRINTITIIVLRLSLIARVHLSSRFVKH